LSTAHTEIVVKLTGLTVILADLAIAVVVFSNVSLLVQLDLLKIGQLLQLQFLNLLGFEI
jgi:hypothetical protein